MFLWVSISIIWALFFSTVFYSWYFKISRIEFERDDLNMDPREVLSILNDLRWKNIFFTSVSTLETKLRTQNKKFKNIDLKRKLPDIISVRIESFENIFLLNTFFYKQNPKTNIKERYLQKFYISQWWELKDYIQDQILSSWDLLEIQVKEDVWQMYAWEIFINWDVIYQIQSILEKVESEYKFEITEVNYYKYARELRLNTSLWQLWITLNKDIDLQLKKIKQFRQNYWEVEQFSYLDLRINQRIIYNDWNKR